MDNLRYYIKKITNYLDDKLEKKNIWLQIRQKLQITISEITNLSVTN